MACIITNEVNQQNAYPFCLYQLEFEYKFPGALCLFIGRKDQLPVGGKKFKKNVAIGKVVYVNKSMI